MSPVVGVECPSDDVNGGEVVRILAKVVTKMLSQGTEYAEHNDWQTGSATDKEVNKWNNSCTDPICNVLVIDQKFNC